MENLKKMKDCLIGAAERQVYGNVENVNAQELGEVVDMIKDLSEAIYYSTITDAMQQHEEPRYYNSRSGDGGHPDDGTGRWGGMIRRYDDGKMSYSTYREPAPYAYRDGVMRDTREGKSGERRRMYMEGKGYKDKTKQMQELEQYMQELASDMTEMIQDASPEEKQLLQSRIATLAAKVK